MADTQMPQLVLKEASSSITLSLQSPLTIRASDYFDIGGVYGTIVAIDTNAALGDSVIYVELFDRAGTSTRSTPATATNFLSYVNKGSYDGSIIHRSVANFVIQGGGFTAPTTPANQPGGSPKAITALPPIVNEPGNSNLRGTIAMAKLGGNPDSATNQWFINLADNSDNLDGQNGGFTVFGRVLGDGMAIVDSMAAAKRYNASTYYQNGALSELPLWDVPLDNIIVPDNFLTIEDARVESIGLSVNLPESAPLRVVSLDGGLTLARQEGIEFTDSVTIVLTATSPLDGTSISRSLAIDPPREDIGASVDMQSKGNGIAGSIESSVSGSFREDLTLIAPFVTDDPDGDATNPNYSYQWFKGSSAITNATASTYVVPVTGAGAYKVAVTYADAQGFIATLDSPEQVVSTFNNGNGTPAFITGNGAFREGVTLTAPVVTGDPDGDATNPNYAYQWFRNNTLISDATNSTYAVPVTGAGTYKVAVTCTDAQGFTATVDSPDQVVTAGDPLPIQETPSAPKEAERINHIAQGKGDLITTNANQIDRITLAPVTFTSGSPDVITGFLPTEDKIVLPKAVFAKLKNTNMTTISSKKQLKKSKSGLNSTQLVYNKLTGEVIYDENGKKKGLGAGGVFARFEDATLPTLTASNFELV
jgi:cyclophilin family peptidyl-prolyl cis-trans isomerase